MHSLNNRLFKYFRPDTHELNQEEKDSECRVTFQTDNVIEIGLKIECLITVVNRATQGLIMTFCISSIACLILSCFQIVAYLGLNNLPTQDWQSAHPVASMFVVVMFLVRIYSLMNSGQKLGVKVKQSRRSLDDFMIKEDKPCNLNERSYDKLSVLRNRLEVYQYLNPISPYSVFGLSKRTFGATLASMVTYIIVLIKLRGVETSKTSSDFVTMNDTVLT